jgi:hypothetical protein
MPYSPLAGISLFSKTWEEAKVREKDILLLFNDSVYFIYFMPSNTYLVKLCLFHFVLDSMMLNSLGVCLQGVH